MTNQQNTSSDQATLSTIYQAKKSGDRTVNVLKQQFQNKIERIVQDNGKSDGQVKMTKKPAPPAPASKKVHSKPVSIKQSNYNGNVSKNQKKNKEGGEVRQLQREKSFDEARNAVQSQIERIFQKAAAAKKQQELEMEMEGGNGDPVGVGTHGTATGVPVVGSPSRYTMHGVSHLTPEDIPVISPLPVHHGITLKVVILFHYF